MTTTDQTLDAAPSADTEVLDAPAATTIAEFSASEEGLAALRKELAGVEFDVSTVAGDKAARAARLRCVQIRSAVKTAYENWNRPMLATQRAMRARMGEIETEVKAIEDPIDAQIKAEEQRKADIKAAKEAAERERLQAIQTRINLITNFAAAAAGLPAAEIDVLRQRLAEMPLTEELYEHRAGEATLLAGEVAEKLDQMHAAAVAAEAEAKRLADERAAFEEQRRQEEARAAEALRQQEAELAAERARLDAQRREQEERAAQAQRQEEARQTAARAEQKRLDDEAAERRRKEEAALACTRAALSKIQAIQGMVVLAGQHSSTGNLQAIRDDLAEVKAWEPTADAYGDMLDAAVQAKGSASAEISRILDAAEAREIEAQAERDAAAAQRAEQESRQRAEAEARARRERADFLAVGPGADEILRVLAHHFTAEPQHVVAWLRAIDLEALATPAP